MNIVLLYSSWDTRNVSLIQCDIQALDLSIKDRTYMLARDWYNESLDLVTIAYIWVLCELRKSRDSFLEEKEDHIIMI